MGGIYQADGEITRKSPKQAAQVSSRLSFLRLFSRNCADIDNPRIHVKFEQISDIIRLPLLAMGSLLLSCSLIWNILFSFC